MNHAERREMESVLQERGMKPSQSDEADLAVVHTCSVTGQAAAKSRNAIRRASKTGNTVFVTGCFTGTDPEVAKTLGDHVVTQAGKEPMVNRFADEIDKWLQTPNSKSKRESDATSLPITTLPQRQGQHIRAEVRIQDGCDAHCTFCIIPKIRTTLRSKTIKDVVTEVEKLVNIGHQEIVFTGVFIGAYGHRTALRRKQENPEREYLADLIDAVAQVDGLKRLRISSMEPGDVTPVLIDAIVANQPIVAAHLHLPLQSGSEDVLRKMNRQYSINAYQEMIELINAQLTINDIPPAITTDIICGFPTETDSDFERTIAIAKAVKYLHIHVFPYSVRSGTAAARWGQLQPEIIKERVQQLIAVDRELSIEYRKNLIGKTVNVLLEQDAENGVKKGRCGHYAEISLKTKQPIGAIVPAKVTQVQSEQTIASEGLQII